jgi:hypothetical protein
VFFEKGSRRDLSGGASGTPVQASREKRMVVRNRCKDSITGLTCGFGHGLRTRRQVVEQLFDSGGHGHKQSMSVRGHNRRVG